MKDVNTLEIAVAALLGLLCLLELRDRQFRGALALDRARLRRNLGYLAASVAAMAALRAFHGWAASLRGAPPEEAAGGALLLQFAACAAVAELFEWLVHYVKHRNAFLWKFHFQHHREDQYNIWLATHTHALEVVLSGALLSVVLCVLAFPLIAVEAYLAFYTVAKVFQHSARAYALGWLGRIVITPAYHRLHHEVPGGCNYGSTLTIVDVLFGTARWPAPRPGAAPPPLGVDPAERLPFGFWREMTHFLRPSCGIEVPPLPTVPSAPDQAGGAGGPDGARP